MPPKGSGRKNKNPIEEVYGDEYNPPENPLKKVRVESPERQRGGPGTIRPPAFELDPRDENAPLGGGGESDVDETTPLEEDAQSMDTKTTTERQTVTPKRMANQRREAGRYSLNLSAAPVSPPALPPAVPGLGQVPGRNPNLGLPEIPIGVVPSRIQQYPLGQQQQQQANIPIQQQQPQGTDTERKSLQDQLEQEIKDRKVIAQRLANCNERLDNLTARYEPTKALADKAEEYKDIVDSIRKELLDVAKRAEAGAKTEEFKKEFKGFREQLDKAIGSEDSGEVAFTKRIIELMTKCVNDYNAQERKLAETNEQFRKSLLSDQECRGALLECKRLADEAKNNMDAEISDLKKQLKEAKQDLELKVGQIQGLERESRELGVLRTDLDNKKNELLAMRKDRNERETKREEAQTELTKAKRELEKERQIRKMVERRLEIDLINIGDAKTMTKALDKALGKELKEVTDRVFVALNLPPGATILQIEDAAEGLANQVKSQKKKIEELQKQISSLKPDEDPVNPQLFEEPRNPAVAAPLAPDRKDAALPPPSETKKKTVTFDLTTPMSDEEVACETELRECREELKKAREQLTELQNRLNQRNSVIQINATNTDDIDRLRNELKTCRTSKDAYFAQLNNCNTTLKSRDNKIADLQQELITARSDAVAKVAEFITTTTNDVNRAENEYKATITQLNGQITELQNNNLQLQEQVGKLRSEYKDDHSRKNNCEQKLATCQAALKKLQDEKQQLEDRMKRIERERQSADEDEQKKFNKKLKELQERIASLQEQLNKCDSERKAFWDQLEICKGNNSRFVIRIGEMMQTIDRGTFDNNELKRLVELKELALNVQRSNDEKYYGDQMLRNNQKTICNWIEEAMRFIGNQVPSVYKSVDNQGMLLFYIHALCAEQHWGYLVARYMGRNYSMMHPLADQIALLLYEQYNIKPSNQTIAMFSATTRHNVIRVLNAFMRVFHYHKAANELRTRTKDGKAVLKPDAVKRILDFNDVPDMKDPKTYALEMRKDIMRAHKLFFKWDLDTSNPVGPIGWNTYLLSFTAAKTNLPLEILGMLNDKTNHDKIWRLISRGDVNLARYWRYDVSDPLVLLLPMWNVIQTQIR